MGNCDPHCCCRQETDDDDDNESTVTEPIGDGLHINPERVAQGHKLAALMKKRKDEILSNKEQPAPVAKPIGKLLITTLATTEIFFSLRAMDQHDALLTSLIALMMYFR